MFGKSVPQWRLLSINLEIYLNLDIISPIVYKCSGIFTSYAGQLVAGDTDLIGVSGNFPGKYISDLRAKSFYLRIYQTWIKSLLKDHARVLDFIKNVLNVFG